MQLVPYIVRHTNLSEKSVENTVALLNEDCTVPFISRYRKERTGNLDEVQIGSIVEYKAQFEALEKRKVAIIKAVKEQDALTSELEAKFLNCTVIFLSKKAKRPRRKPHVKMVWNRWPKLLWHNVAMKSSLSHPNI
jgi:hypothetical protein